MIDSREASEALTEINETARRVRQSTIYNLASLMMIMWGALVFAGYAATFMSPRNGGIVWIAIYAVGIAGSFVISRFDHAREGVRTVDGRR